MLSGGLGIDIDSLPETQKIYYTATSKIEPNANTIGVVIVNKWNSSTKEGVIACKNIIKEIGNYAFHNTRNLTSVTIPDSVTAIGAWAFYYCDSLTSVYCKATTPPSFDSGVFESNGSGRKIYVPTDSVSAYKSAEGWSKYASAIEGYEF